MKSAQPTRHHFIGYLVQWEELLQNCYGSRWIGSRLACFTNIPRWR